MGWQSNQAAHAPEMAILLCPLPGGAARMSIKHTPAQMAGAPQAASLLGGTSSSRTSQHLLALTVSACFATTSGLPAASQE